MANTLSDSEMGKKDNGIKLFDGKGKWSQVIYYDNGSLRIRGQ